MINPMKTKQPSPKKPTKNPHVTTRPALPTDADDIVRIWNGYIRDSLVTFNSIEKTIQEVQDLIANQPFFVAETTQNIIGFATYGAFRKGIGYAHSKEHTVMVAPDNTQGGAGRALMSAIMDEARSNGTHSLFAGITGSNQAAIDFHRNLGFIHRAHIPEAGYKFAQWHDLVLMQYIFPNDSPPKPHSNSE